MTHGLVAVNRRERSVNSSVGIGYLCSWITGKGSPPGTHPDQAIAVARATVTTDERRKQAANRVLYRLPSSNLSEAEEQRRVDMEPRRFDREKGLVTDATSLINEVSEVQALSELFPRTMPIDKPMIELETCVHCKSDNVRLETEQVPANGESSRRPCKPHQDA